MLSRVACLHLRTRPPSPGVSQLPEQLCKVSSAVQRGAVLQSSTLRPFEDITHLRQSEVRRARWIGGELTTAQAASSLATPLKSRAASYGPASRSLSVPQYQGGCRETARWVSRLNAQAGACPAWLVAALHTAKPDARTQERDKITSSAYHALQPDVGAGGSLQSSRGPGEGEVAHRVAYHSILDDACAP